MPMDKQGISFDILPQGCHCFHYFFRSEKKNVCEEGKSSGKNRFYGELTLQITTA
jgi:hypothetical protein